MPLTKRQKEVLGFLKDYLQEHGYSPSLEEIASHFRLASLNGVYKHLTALEERGFIRRLSNQARSIQLVQNPHGDRSSLPILGVVAAGRPIEAVPDSEEITVPESFLTRGRNFVLRVSGDSMIDEQIRDGDLIVVEERRTAYNGETVVALIDGQEVTLKKFYLEGDQIRLQPANPTLAPIVVSADRVQIQGVVTGVLRRYQ